jgi:hypothetical protein
VAEHDLIETITQKELTLLTTLTFGVTQVDIFQSL